MARHNSAPAPDALWQRVKALPLPEDLWNGRRLGEELVPDNLLLFPFLGRASALREGYGTYHPRYVLDILLSGRARYHLEGREYLLEAGEAVLAFPHQLHGVQPGEAPGRWLVATFEVAHAATLEPLRGAPRRLGAAELELVEALVASYQSGPVLEAAARLARLLGALCEAPGLPASRVSTPEPNPERAAFVVQAEQWVESGEPLGALAARLGVGEHVLRALFRQHTGSTPASYQRRQRLAAAARALQAGQGNVTEVAARLGFSSVYAFSRMFKTVYGLPPKQYELLARKAR